MTKLLAMIPGRIGSTRLKMKNLALLDGKPLMSYAIEAAKASQVFDRIVVNADHPVFERIAAQAGVDFYLRPEALGSASTTSDEVVYDFMVKHPAEIVAWVNPTSPLQSPGEIRSVVTHFLAEHLDSLITVKEERVHALLNGHPLNFHVEEPFARTQDLAPIHFAVYSVMMWRTITFMQSFQERGHALLSGKVGYVPVSKLSAVIVKTPEDLLIAEELLRLVRQGLSRAVQYESCTQDLVKGATA